MNLSGKRVYTGRMQVVGGWEIRPFAIKSADGSFLPGLSTRKHAAGSTGQDVSLERTCLNKEEAFEVALARGLSLVCGA